MKRWTLLGLLVVAAAGASAGCDVFDESLAPPKDGGSNGNGMDPGCDNGSLQPPPRPDVEDGDSIPEELVFALKDVTLDDVSAGLNVDNMCTGPDGPWSCLPEEQLGAQDPEPVVDRPMGQENQFSAEVFQTIDLAFQLMGQDLQLTSRKAEAKGFGNPIIRLTDYNGTPNDPQVTVIVSQSVFTVPGDGSGTRPSICMVQTDNGAVPYTPVTGCDDGDTVLDCAPTGSTRIPPLDLTVEEVTVDGMGEMQITSYHPGWEDGSLWFWGREDTFVLGNESDPVVEDDVAYVVDDQLVVRLPDNVLFKLVGEGQAVQARLTDAFAIGQLERDSEGNLTGSMEGGVLVAGRWPVVALLETAQSVGICEGDPLLDMAATIFNRAADVRTEPDSEGMDVPCNAVSFGITFTAHRGNWGGIAPGQPVPNACAEMQMDAGVPTDGGMADAGIPSCGTDGGT